MLDVPGKNRERMYLELQNQSCLRHMVFAWCERYRHIPLRILVYSAGSVLKGNKRLKEVCVTRYKSMNGRQIFHWMRTGFSSYNAVSESPTAASSLKFCSQRRPPRCWQSCLPIMHGTSVVIHVTGLQARFHSDMFTSLVNVEGILQACSETHPNV